MTLRTEPPVMRALIIDDRAKTLIKAVREYAEAPANFYWPSAGGRPPGDDRRHVCQLNSYRCVFSVSGFEGKLYRHLSISVPSEKYPHVLAALTIADMFGFTGWDQKTFDRLPESWQGAVNEKEHCIVLAQAL